MAIIENKEFGALGDIPNDSVKMAGDVVPMLKDPFVYIDLLLKQGVKPLETIAPMKEIYGYDSNEALEVLNNFLQR